MAESNQVAYVNYQRLYTNPETELVSVKLNGQALAQIDQRIVAIGGQDWLEIGFLAPVLDQNQAEAEIKLQNKLSLADKQRLTLYKQAGLRAINYRINFADQTKELQLLSDLSLDLD